jgi:hypothetical protein
MCSVAVRQAASPVPSPAPLEGAGLEGPVAGLPDGADGAALDAGALDGTVAGALDGAVAVAVTVTVGGGGAAGWPGDAEPQAATSDAEAAAPVSHATRRTRPDVLAAITRLAGPARPAVVVASVVVAAWVVGTRAGGRGYVGIACSLVRR